MIPTVFVSSTVADLQHLRDAVRDRIASLGYTPVLSDHNGVGYVPTLSAVKSCFAAVKVSSIAVLIVGKRYGTLLDDGSGISVTHSELRSARHAEVPMFCLVDRDVLAYEQVFDANQKSGSIAFPETMDQAPGTFALLKEIRSAPTNNAILPYGNTTEACDVLTMQLAHFFGNLLAQETNPAGRQISEVLSELTKLREEVRRQQEPSTPPGTPSHASFVQATQFLVSESYKQLRTFLTVISGGVVEAITDLLRFTTLDDYLNEKGIRLSFTDDEALPPLHEGMGRNTSVRSRAWFLVPTSLWTGADSPSGKPEKPAVGVFTISGEKDLTMNLTAHKYLGFCYSSIRGMALADDDMSPSPHPES
jgi:Domain of unknown function (DUF4062)